jgi:tRNA dimethylallyltransferase
VIDNHPLIAVVGPTGAGKSEIALRLAAIFNGEIVNCDSVQVYEGLEIGSAKIRASERRGIPHHLLDVVPPMGEMTAGDYAREATVVLAGIKERSALPIVVGGTGFYLRALLDGLSPAPTRNAKLRERLAGLAARRPAALHRFLKKCDAGAAERIHPNDHQKLMRAIEMGGNGKEARQGLRGFRVLKIGLNPDRTKLYERLNRRSEWMFANGLVEETQALLASGVPANAKALGTLGYKQAVATVQQRMSLEEAIAECQLLTRHYAKRQLTWFRGEAEMNWLSGFGDEEGVQAAAQGLVSAFLAATSV